MASERVVVTRWARLLAAAQAAHPWRWIAGVVVLALSFGLAASRLELRTRYEQLLPAGAESVVALERIRARTKPAQSILVVLEGDDRAALRAFGDALAPRLVALGPDAITGAEDGVQEGRRFLLPRAGLFLDTSELEKLRSELDERWDRAVARETGTSLDDDDGDAKETVADASWRARLEHAGGSRITRYPDGYYERKDGKALVVFARSSVAAGDLERMKAVVGSVHACVHDVAGSRADFASIRVTYAGDMIAGLDEYGAVRADLASVGVLGVGMILVVVMLYFRHVRAVIVLGSSIAVGLAWTFGATAIAIGHLNVATSFLFSIVAGNGVNTGILYMARYDEERRRGHDSATAIRIAHETTWPSTATAAFASAAAYASLAVTHFPAFRQFAFIGATGMVACWIATITLVPPLLVVVDGGRVPMRGVPYGEVFARIVRRASGPIMVLAAIVCVSGVAATSAFLSGDPVEYDLRNVQTDRVKDDPTQHAWAVATDILGQWPSAAIVLAHSPAEADEIREHLARTPEASRQVGDVHTLSELVAPDQETKLPTLLAMSARLHRARELRYISDADWSELEPILPPPDLAAYTAADVPARLAEPFTENDGTRGNVVLIEPKLGESGDDSTTSFDTPTHFARSTSEMAASRTGPDAPSSLRTSCAPSWTTSHARSPPRSSSRCSRWPSHCAGSRMSPQSSPR